MLAIDDRTWSRQHRTRVQDDEIKLLLDALHGRGAFRLFKSTIRRLGVEDDWFRFRASALEEIAMDWLDTHGIAHR